jgi:hypothetical protein
MKDIRKLVIFVLIFTFILIENSWAYIDPGTGSLIFQVIVGFFVGIAYVIKVFWRSIFAFFANIFSKDKSQQSQE